MRPDPGLNPQRTPDSRRGRHLYQRGTAAQSAPKLSDSGTSFAISPESAGHLGAVIWLGPHAAVASGGVDWIRRPLWGGLAWGGSLAPGGLCAPAGWPTRMLDRLPRAKTRRKRAKSPEAEAWTYDAISFSRFCWSNQAAGPAQGQERGKETPYQKGKNGGRVDIPSTVPQS